MVPRKRGRKPGTKAQPHWLRPGPKPKATQGKHSKATSTGKTGKQKQTFKNRNTHASDKKNQLRARLKSIYIMNKISEMEDKFSSLDADGNVEQVMLYSIQLTYAAAMKSDNATEFLTADNIEKLKLEAAKTWREPK